MRSFRSLPYHGRKAEIYDTKREGTRRWQRENELAESMLSRGCTALDVPFGTGRMLPAYRRLRVKWDGVDASSTMLDLAVRKGAPRARLRLGDITALNLPDSSRDAVVCLRMLHLMDEEHMLLALAEICRVASKVIVLTVQLGPKYAEGVDVATHDDRKFRAAVRRHGWRVAEEHVLSRLGWRVMKLVRK